jgi:transcriptional regulator with XRE-family HTH domain
MEMSPGNFLREARLQLQLGLRDVQKLSSKIAAKESNKRFHISVGRLGQIENDNEIPSAFKIFTLAAIYGLSFHEILTRYGVDSDRIHKYREEIRLSATRPVSAELRNLNTKVTIPVRLDPTFKWETTQLINRVVAFWGEIPAAFLLEYNPRQHMYAYIGLEDTTMYPLLRPGSLVMIDGEHRRVASGGWNNEYERPIYLVELRDGYLCGWCHASETHITILPHPVSKAPSKTFSLTNEAEVIGQVVAVAMRLVPPQDQTIQAHDTVLPTKS